MCERNAEREREMEEERGKYSDFHSKKSTVTHPANFGSLKSQKKVAPVGAVSGGKEESSPRGMDLTSFISHNSYPAPSAPPPLTRTLGRDT